MFNQPGLIGYQGETAQVPGQLVKPTVTEALLERKKYYEEGLKKTNAALEALKANPGVEEVLNLIQKASY